MKLIKAVDLAKMMGISRQGVYYLIKKKLITYYLVDTKMYVPDFEALNLLRRQMLKDGFELKFVDEFIDISILAGVNPWEPYKTFRGERMNKRISWQKRDQLMDDFRLSMRAALKKLKNEPPLDN